MWSLRSNTKSDNNLHSCCHGWFMVGVLKLEAKNALRLVFIEFLPLYFKRLHYRGIERFLIFLANASSRKALGTSILSVNCQHRLNPRVKGQTPTFSMRSLAMFTSNKKDVSHEVRLLHMRFFCYSKLVSIKHYLINRKVDSRSPNLYFQPKHYLPSGLHLDDAVSCLVTIQRTD